MASWWTASPPYCCSRGLEPCSSRGGPPPPLSAPPMSYDDDDDDYDHQSLKIKVDQHRRAVIVVDIHQ
uniref:Uncharacterized protein n=1 Tax=Arundo donax TaxID=35708 RepID=A0A0A9GND0_ARUDO